MKYVLAKVFNISLFVIVLSFNSSQSSEKKEEVPSLTIISGSQTVSSSSAVPTLAAQHVLQKKQLPIATISTLKNEPENDNEEFFEFEENIPTVPSSTKYIVEFSHSLDGTSKAYPLSNKKYVIYQPNKNIIQVRKKDKNYKREWFQANTEIYGEAKVLGIVPGKHGDRFVLQNNICTWVNPQSIDFGSLIEPPETKNMCKNTIEIGQFYIDPNDQLVYVKERNTYGGITKKILVYNGQEIKAYALIPLAGKPEKKDLIGILTAPDQGYPEFLIVKEKLPPTPSPQKITSSPIEPGPIIKPLYVQAFEFIKNTWTSIKNFFGGIRGLFGAYGG